MRPAPREKRSRAGGPAFRERKVPVADTAGWVLDAKCQEGELEASREACGRRGLRILLPLKAMGLWVSDPTFLSPGFYTHNMQILHMLISYQ